MSFGITGDVSFQGVIHSVDRGRKAWTTKAGEEMEKEGHVQDTRSKKLKM